MTSSAWQHSVLPHGPLQTIVPNQMWIISGNLPHGSMSRTMVIFRLDSGRLLLHSPIALQEEAQRALEALGPIDCIIIPNGLHRIDGPRYKVRYPLLKVLTPAAARSKVAAKVDVDDTCENALPGLGIEILQADGLKSFELAYKFPTTQGPVLVVTDMLMNLPLGTGLEGWILRRIGSTGFFGMTFIARLIMLRDRRAFKGWLRIMAGKQFFAILVAHGKPVLDNPAQALLEAEQRL